MTLWIGWLTVEFADLEQLSAFRFEGLSVDKVSRMWAYNAEDMLVYEKRQGQRHSTPHFADPK